MAEPQKNRKPQDVQPKSEPVTEIVRTKSDSFVAVYSNNVQIEGSLWDFKLFFGEIDHIENGKMHIKDQVKITMSPQHTKVLLNVLRENVARYEAQVGEIKIGPKESVQ